jgi:hypothetical protein
MITTKPMIMARIIPITAGMKYRSAALGACVGIGVVIVPINVAT